MKTKTKVSLPVCLVLALISFLFLSTVWAEDTPGNSINSQKSSSELEVLTNYDVIEMVKAELDVNIIITKIINSHVDFDVSTKGLINLKNAHVPSPVICIMIKRPKGPVPPNHPADIEQK
jgi:hypothetical protein